MLLIYWNNSNTNTQKKARKKLSSLRNFTNHISTYSKKRTIIPQLKPWDDSPKINYKFN